MVTYLDEILARKRVEIRALAETLDLADLRRRALPCTTDVIGALRRQDGPVRVIAEHKRASPSRGPIRPDSDAAEVAKAYEAAGAAAISVLTDAVGFGGSPEDLQAVRAAVSIPVLCKDFILCPLQVHLARAWGADLVLLIVAALSAKELKDLHRLVKSYGMTPLVEVHDAHELAVAGDLGAAVIGVNHRNLHTFEIDLALSERLGPKFPAGAIRVAESGIRTPADVRAMEGAGYDAILVGEQFMTQPDPGAALRALMGI